jgi:hypothetical protein
MISVLDTNYSKAPLFVVAYLTTLSVIKTTQYRMTKRLLNEEQFTERELSGETKVPRGNKSSRRKPNPAPLRPPQITHDPTVIEYGSLWWDTSISEHIHKYGNTRKCMHDTPINETWLMLSVWHVHSKIKGEIKRCIFCCEHQYYARHYHIVMYGDYASLIRRVLIRMIGFIRTWVTHSRLITLTHRQYSTIAHLHTLQTTVAYALGFPVSTIRFPAADLNTDYKSITQPHTPNVTAL